MRKRADDICHIDSMLLYELSGNQARLTLPEGDYHVILIAHDLTPADTLKLDENRLAGIVTELGVKTSHTVILAKAISIPAIAGAKGVLEAPAGKQSIIDGENGWLWIELDSETLHRYNDKAAKATRL